MFTAYADGRFDLNGRWTRCALGRGGVVEARAKREGDGKTPLGFWPIRRVLYRPDRLGAPATCLAALPIRPDDGWCDDPLDPAYNRPVRLPHDSRSEQLWRADGLYDLLCVLAHNDDPPQPGAGSAIFLHLAQSGYTATEGCIALLREDLEALLIQARPNDGLTVLS